MKIVLLSPLFLVLWAAAPAAAGADFDHSAFDAALKAHVDAEGLVDYAGMARDPRFRAYLAALEGADPERLDRAGRLAFWINAYNAVTIDKVIRKRPRKSVRETLVPGVWISTRFFTTRDHVVAGRRLSQDDIEHRILRPVFRDPRVHFALICASMGCPKMPRAAYTAADVDRRLDEEVRRYLASGRGLRVDRRRNVLYVSRIFEWFEEDFGGPSGVVAFLRKYAPAEARAFLEGSPRIDYLPYDWSLNAQAPLR
ncbi:DUF547 domain-containing protein [Dissulfurirhabdus thermomarina]|uniref:DUF547 domain-containing protein n=1 Tax=Dissulfurirhabdus thermomarina TaxID=1765737 RepID=A0A6N9TS94_DISTH|nr:DUF547 domain-containing protein [Dissulfurirhabdus thermomarina]NDY42624.1 DUF547 domain-containing protein [Dissulfurirhabdus thermomarina]NMX23063.1 DUF547 domain-containing protein [Dissulfurirhabdus thermomarina]